MAKTKLINSNQGIYSIYCEMCQINHHIPTVGDHPVWTFNGDLEYPTFMPSVVVSSKYSAENNANPYICHFFIKNGTIEYQGDCTHEFKNKTLSLKDIE
jgi:hypothetical protein